MSNDLVIKDNKNKTIGWVKDYGDRKVGIHFKKGFVGNFNPSTGITFDKSGRIYCYGDGIADLVRQAERG